MGAGFHCAVDGKSIRKSPLSAPVMLLAGNKGACGLLWSPAPHEVLPAKGWFVSSEQNPVFMLLSQLALQEQP